MQFLELPSRYGMLAAISWGHPAAEPVIALHGWLDNAASFSRLAPQLVDVLPGYRIIAVDLPGHGHSPHLLMGSHYPFWTWSEVLMDLLTFFGRPLHVIGHSMGAGAALLVAGSCPELFRSLVSIDSLGPVVNRPEEAVHQFRRAMLEGDGRISSGFRTIEEALSLRLRANTWLDREQVMPVVERNLEQRAGRWHWRTDPRLRNHSRLRFSEDMLTGFLQGACQPFLMLQASHGLLDEALVKQRFAYLPSATGQVVQGHHHCHLDPASLPGLLTAISMFWQESCSGN